MFPMATLASTRCMPQSGLRSPPIVVGPRVGRVGVDDQRQVGVVAVAHALGLDQVGIDDPWRGDLRGSCRIGERLRRLEAAEQRALRLVDPEVGLQRRRASGQVGRVDARRGLSGVVGATEEAVGGRRHGGPERLVRDHTPGLVVGLAQGHVVERATDHVALGHRQRPPEQVRRDQAVAEQRLVVDLLGDQPVEQARSLGLPDEHEAPPVALVGDVVAERVEHVAVRDGARVGAVLEPVPAADRRQRGLAVDRGEDPTGAGEPGDLVVRRWRSPRAPRA
jgi:hypothetical protein